MSEHKDNTASRGIYTYFYNDEIEIVNKICTPRGEIFRCRVLIDENAFCLVETQFANKLEGEIHSDQIYTGKEIIKLIYKILFLEDNK